MSSTAKKLKTHFTYKDYLAWPEDERWELIRGVPYNMSPAPSRRHQDLLRDLGLQIALFLRNKKCMVYYAPFDVRLAEKNKEDTDIVTVVQPDIVIVCDKKKLDDRGCIGTPDIVIEILSPHTSLKDKREKMALYEHHLVKEYWIVDPNDNSIMTFKLNRNKEYLKPRVYSKEDKIKTPVLRGLTIDLKSVF